LPLSDDSLRTNLEIVGDHLHLLVESSPEGMVICDDSNRIIFANPQFCNMFGWERDEVTGKDIDEVVAGAEEVAAEASLVSSTVFSTPHMIPQAVRVRKDGKRINVSILAGPVLDNGRTVGAYGIYRDISFKKKAEDDIRREKAFFENLFQKAPEAILLCGREARGIKVNRAFTNLFGYTQEDIEGKDINPLIAKEPELLREARGLDALSWSSGKPFSLDTWRTRKDGTRIPVGILQFPFKVDDENEVEYTIYRDRTSELRAKAALRREKAFFENLFEACPDAIILSNREGEVLRANRAFYELFGYSEEDRVIGGDIFSIVARNPRSKKEARELEERFWGGEEIDREVVRQRKDGSDIHLHLTQVPFRLDALGPCLLDGNQARQDGDVTNRDLATAAFRRRAGDRAGHVNAVGILVVVPAHAGADIELAITVGINAWHFDVQQIVIGRHTLLDIPTGVIRVLVFFGIVVRADPTQWIVRQVTGLPARTIGLAQAGGARDRTGSAGDHRMQVVVAANAAQSAEPVERHKHANVVALVRL